MIIGKALELRVKRLTKREKKNNKLAGDNILANNIKTSTKSVARKTGIVAINVIEDVLISFFTFIVTHFFLLLIILALILPTVVLSLEGVAIALDGQSLSIRGSGGTPSSYDTFSQAETKTQALLKDNMLLLLALHGASGNQVIQDEIDNYAKANNIKYDYQWSKGSNGFLSGTEWCAATAKGTLNKHIENNVNGETRLVATYINGTTTTVTEKLQEISGNTFPASDCADLGISDATRVLADGEYDTKCGVYANYWGEFHCKYVRAHYLANANLKSFDYSSREKPSVSKYVRDGVIRVETESRYQPKLGDIITFCWGTGARWSHVGLVYDYRDGNVISYEGNMGSSVLGTRSTPLDDASIGFIFEIDYIGLERDFGVPSVSADGTQSEFDINKYIPAQAKALGVSNLKDTTQVLDVVCKGTKCTITNYNKTSNKWLKGNIETDGVIGRNGLGTIGDSDDDVHEGSGKTPKGAYYLGVNFGGFGVPVDNLKIAWKDVTKKQAWWGTSKSGGTHPNQYYEANEPEVEADRNEDLTAYSTGSYKYSVLIEYNYGSAFKQNKGSAFFLHVKGNETTAGCVATSEDSMLKIIKWLDKSKKPMIFIHLEDKGVLSASRTVTKSVRGATEKATTSTDAANQVVSLMTKADLVSAGNTGAEWFKKTYPAVWEWEQNVLSKYCETYVHSVSKTTIVQKPCFTYYSESVLPGGGLNIPGRTHADGFVVDGNGYIVLAGSASQKERGLIVPTPFGRLGKVYDECDNASFDVYTE